MAYKINGAAAMQRGVCLLLLESVKWVKADVSDFTTELKAKIKN